MSKPTAINRSCEDDRLGLRSIITRRDFLNGVLLGSGAALLGAAPAAEPLSGDPPWDGYGGVGDYARSHGNSRNVMRAAHGIRDGKYDKPASDWIDTNETFDLVVVGAGLSGLSAAYHFRKQRRASTCLILDNHLVFGGEAKRNEFLVRGQRLIGPQGANEFDIPQPGEDGFELYDELGIPRQFQYAPWNDKNRRLQFDRTNYGFQLWVDEAVSFGTCFSTGKKPHWVANLWGNRLQDAPWSEALKKDFLIWRYGDREYHHGQQFDRWLDTMTYKQYLENVMGLRPEVTRYADPIMAAAVGLGCDAISANTAYSIGMPGFSGLPPVMDYSRQWEKVSPLTWHAFPGGNDGFARYFVKALIPGAIKGSTAFADVLNGSIDFNALDRSAQAVRLRLGATVVRVEHEGSSEQSQMVGVCYAIEGKTYRLKARRVTMAGGGWVTQRVVRDLPTEYQGAYDQFHHSPMLVINVALNEWRFLYRLGLTAFRWFEGFGFCCNMRQPMWVGDYQPPLDPTQPTLLTFYVPFYYPGLSIQEQGSRGRNELLSRTFLFYEHKIRQQLMELFSQSGFNPKRHIAGIILNRWGHAYVNPQPGFYFSADGKPAPHDIIRSRFGRIAFGHSELVGHQYWLGAIGEGRRAAEQMTAVD